MVVIISTQVWTDHWVSKHWIAALLAEQGYTVFFIEPLRGIISRGGRMRDLILGPKVSKINGVNVISIAALPAFYRTSGFLRSVYRFALGPQMKKLNEVIGGEYSLLTFDGRSLPLVNRLNPPSFVAYYCVDPVGVGSEPGYGEFQLAHHVDANIAISEHCADEMKEHLKIDEVSIVPHGMAFDEILKDREEVSINQEINCNVMQNKKIIGYTGSIHDTYVNFEFIEHALRELRDSHWIFVGPHKGSEIAENSSKSINSLIKEDCTTFLGSKPVWQLPSYIRLFDVCLIPYRGDIPNGWERRSPVKILHYLRQGKPIVCADVPGVSAYKHLIYTYTTYDQFVKALKLALAEPCDDPIRRKRVEFTKNREASVILEDLKEIIRL